MNLFRANKNSLLTPILFFIVCKILIICAGAALFTIEQRQPPAGHWLYQAQDTTGPFYLDLWRRWDSFYILHIAENGYTQVPIGVTPYPTLPLYPYAIRALTGFTQNNLLSGVIITNIAFCLALIFLWKLLCLHYDSSIARKSLICLMLFPTSFVFSMIYTESLFFFLAVSGFYFAYKNRWMIAGICGSLACMTRIIGVILVITYLVIYLEQTGFNFKKIKPNIFWLGLIPFGFLGASLIQYQYSHEHFSFIKSSDFWGRSITWPWISVINNIKLSREFWQNGIFPEMGVIRIIFLIIVVLALILGLKRLKPSYAAYLCLGLLVPLSSQNLLSFPRFIIICFPLFVIFAIMSKNKYFFYGYIVCALPTQLYFLYKFLNWHTPF